jgi:glycosyltransferase involved in cell wall biosynthesis
MNISVAMTTYNGARFLQEQLQSIAEQSCLPDQVVIVDDGSSDTTRERLEGFAASAPFKVELHFNESTLGPIKNFQKAVELCSCEIIVLCDQDDRWHPEKLFQIKQAFAPSPNTGLVFSDAELMDENGNLLNLRLWQYTFEKKYESTITSGKAFELLLQHDVVTGATMAFRQCFRNVLLPFPTGIPLLHDGWIAIMIAALGEVSVISQPLMEYRIHPQQSQGIKPFNQHSEAFSYRLQPMDCNDLSPLAKRSSYYFGQIEKLQAVRQRLDIISSSSDRRIPIATIQNRIGYLDRLINHFRVRSGLPRGSLGRAPIVLRELLTLRYHRYSRGWLSAVRDITI